MAQWFHRNPLKASGRPNFELGPIATNIAARMMCSMLADKRQILIAMMADTNASRDAIIDSTNQYISLLMGLSTAADSPDSVELDENDDSDDSNSDHPEPGAKDTTELSQKDRKKNQEAAAAAKKASKANHVTSLRRLVCFTWTDSLDLKHKSPITMRDANFELIGILFNLALWLTKHAARIAATNTIDKPEAIEVFRCLRNAAGIFTYIKTQLLGQIRGDLKKASDLDPTVLEVYILQCLAEAQEVTIARAMELKHDPSIIAPLALETAVMYDKCKCGLQNIPDTLAGKWRAYCLFKATCFRAYAYCFYSEAELKADRCGNAVVSAQEALKYCTQAQNAAKAYRSGSGAEFAFISRLQPYAQRTLTKAQTENSMIYHQKVPTTMPQLKMKPDYGLATPDMPTELNFTVDESWKEATVGFDTTKTAEWIVKKSYNQQKKESMKPVIINEQAIYRGDRAPQNPGGCTVS